MTPIQTTVSNLDMVSRLINELTPEDVSTKEGKKLFRKLTKMKAALEGKIRAYDYIRGTDG